MLLSTGCGAAASAYLGWAWAGGLLPRCLGMALVLPAVPLGSWVRVSAAAARLNSVSRRVACLLPACHALNDAQSLGLPARIPGSLLPAAASGACLLRGVLHSMLALLPGCLGRAAVALGGRCDPPPPNRPGGTPTLLIVLPSLSPQNPKLGAQCQKII